MTHVLAVVSLAAACVAWLAIQRWSGRPAGGCCGARPPEDRDDCASCPERTRRDRNGPASLLLLLAVAVSSSGGCHGGGERRHAGERLLMGTRFAIEVVGEDEDAARAAIEAAFAEVARVEALLSEWKDTSEISAVNRAAGGHAVPVGPELFEVVRRALAISSETDGAFDATFAACGSAWSFEDRRVPSDAELEACTALVDWRAVELDERGRSLRLPRAGMRLGIAGIGKGYGVDRAAAVLEAHGVRQYLVDGGGDVRLSGRPWRVGIRHPRAGRELLGRLVVSSGAVVTSGDYFRSFEKDGVRYHHILDPRSGRPARGCAAVTVTAPDATTADALATGLFVLGPDAGLELADRLPDVQALFVTPSLEVRTSAGFPPLTAP